MAIAKSYILFYKKDKFDQIIKAIVGFWNVLP